MNSLFSKGVNATVVAFLLIVIVAVLLFFRETLIPSVGELTPKVIQGGFSEIGHHKLVLISRGIAVGGAVSLGFLTISLKPWRRFVLLTVSNFFTETAHPVNLAIFRIGFFGSLLFLYNNLEQSIQFSQLPKELMFPPVGLSWFADYLPVNLQLAEISVLLLRVLFFMGMIGLFSRTSALLAAILGFYVIGIPQLFGKVNHSHHLLWFSVILAASRCGDALSVDAMFAAWRRADRGTTEPPAASRAYALPLRFIWLLLGLIYFFPGFWKLWRSGFSWSLGENFKYQLYHKWFELGGWTPIFRLDQYPLLYKLAALGAIIFEIAFIFLIFLPRIRYFVAFGGLIFHEAIKIFMHINFWTLQIVYVSFFDWNTLFRKVGNFLFPEEMYVVYDGNCQLCRRTIATLRVLDVFERITYVNALDGSQLSCHGLKWLDPSALLRDMHAVVGKNYWLGFAAYRVIAFRIPCFWPILPLLYLWPIPAIGRGIYRRVADSRTCNVVQAPSKTAVADSAPPSFRSRPVIFAGVFLLSVNSLLGFAGIVDAWPFACYPKFSTMKGTLTQALELVAVMPQGEVLRLDHRNLQQGLGFPPERFKAMTNRILSHDQQSSQQQAQQLKLLWTLVVQDNPKLRTAETVRFYKSRYSSLPEDWGEQPVERELQFELRL